MEAVFDRFIAWLSRACQPLDELCLRLSGFDPDLNKLAEAEKRWQD